MKRLSLFLVTIFCGCHEDAVGKSTDMAIVADQAVDDLAAAADLRLGVNFDAAWAECAQLGGICVDAEGGLDIYCTATIFATDVCEPLHSVCCQPNACASAGGGCFAQSLLSDGGCAIMGTHELATACDPQPKPAFCCAN